jgi:hypothetical protein
MGSVCRSLRTLRPGLTLQRLSSSRGRRTARGRVSSMDRRPQTNPSAKVRGSSVSPGVVCETCSGVIRVTVGPGTQAAANGPPGDRLWPAIRSLSATRKFSLPQRPLKGLVARGERQGQLRRLQTKTSPEGRSLRTGSQAATRNNPTATGQDRLSLCRPSPRHLAPLPARPRSSRHRRLPLQPLWRISWPTSSTPSPRWPWLGRPC